MRSAGRPRLAEETLTHKLSRTATLVLGAGGAAASDRLSARLPYGTTLYPVADAAFQVHFGHAGGERVPIFARLAPYVNMLDGIVTNNLIGEASVLDALTQRVAFASRSAGHRCFRPTRRPRRASSAVRWSSTTEPRSWLDLSVGRARLLAGGVGAGNVRLDVWLRRCHCPRAHATLLVSLLGTDGRTRSESAAERDPATDGEREGIDFERAKEMLGLRPARRAPEAEARGDRLHARWRRLGIATGVTMPRTYHSQVKLLAQANLVVSAMGTRAVGASRRGQPHEERRRPDPAPRQPHRARQGD